MRSLALLDSTLREGEQFTRTYFTLEQRLQIGFGGFVRKITNVELCAHGLLLHPYGCAISDGRLEQDCSATERRRDERLGSDAEGR